MSLAYGRQMDPAVAFGDGDADGAEWTLTFAGDVILDADVADDPVASPLADRLRDATIALANVEAPVPGAGEPAAKSGPHKRQRDGAIATLADAGFDVACLANNHVMDYGVDGLRATVDECRAAGLEPVGAGNGPDAALEPLVRTIESASGGELSVAVVNVAEREFGVAAEDGPGTAWIAHPAAPDVVRDAADANDVVVVVAHGGVEYVPFPPASRQRALRSFVDAGADAVVGHHPHVPQGWEVYEGAPICYSLGNFCFRMPTRPSTRWGLLADLRFDGDRVSGVRLTLTMQSAGRVSRMAASRRDDHRAYLEEVASITADRDALRAHWQEVADRLFDQRYAGWLRTGTASGPVQTVTAPGAAFGDAFDGDRRGDELLTLLNVIRNESHRDAIETALAVRAGETDDLRTAAVEQRVRELLAWTEDRPLYDLPSLPEKVVRAVRRRL